MRELIIKLWCYAVTAGIAAIIDAGGFALLLSAKLSVAAAAVVSFGVAALVNYRPTSRFVFSRSATIHGFPLFLLAALIGLTVNVGVTLAGVFFFGLPPLVAKLVGIGTAFLLNFGLNVRFVFRTKA
jgi:putative flippase GtrA